MSRLREIREETAKKMEEPVKVRTDYRCKAQGCPNAGSIEDKCYWHWREADPMKWPQITKWVQDNFEKARNWK